TRHPIDPVVRDGPEIDPLTRLQSALFHVARADEDDAPLAENAAVTVIERINCCVVLVVAADRGQPHRIWVADAGILGDAVEDHEIRSSSWRLPEAFTSGGR